MNHNPQYHEDFYAWALNSAKLQRFDDVYRRAFDKAVNETGISEKYFPAKCEYTLEDCLNEDFLPK